MEFFGITLYGPQNYIKDVMKKEYHEPLNKNSVKSLMENIRNYSTCPNKVHKSDIDTIRLIDCYIGRVNGFAYGSSQRFNKMKRKGVIKPVCPSDIYRIPPVTSIEYGWWQCDPDLISSPSTWYLTTPKHPQPTSPNTLILDKVRKNNKYATLF